MGDHIKTVRSADRVVKRPKEVLSPRNGETPPSRRRLPPGTSEPWPPGDPLQDVVRADERLRPAPQDLGSSRIVVPGLFREAEKLDPPEASYRVGRQPVTYERHVVDISSAIANLHIRVNCQSLWVVTGNALATIRLGSPGAPPLPCNDNLIVSGWVEDIYLTHPGSEVDDLEIITSRNGAITLT
jgi:hypothetical protein